MPPCPVWDLCLRHNHLTFSSFLLVLSLQVHVRAPQNKGTINQSSTRWQSLESHLERLPRSEPLLSREQPCSALDFIKGAPNLSRFTSFFPQQQRFSVGGIKECGVYVLLSFWNDKTRTPLLVILQTVFGELYKLKSMGDVPCLPCGFFVINMVDDRFKIKSFRRETKILLRQKHRLVRSCLDIEPSETYRYKIILNENNSFT